MTQKINYWVNRDKNKKINSLFRREQFKGQEKLTNRSKLIKEFLNREK